MARSQTVVSTSNLLCDENFSLQNAIANVIRKARFKQIGANMVAKRSFTAAFRALIEGNNAGARYRRCAYEGSHRVSAAMLAEKRRASLSGPQGNAKLDWANNEQVRNRFWRQDNVRFNSVLQEQKKTLPGREGWVARLSRWAHHANGVTELGAAPTGMSLRIAKLVTAPNQNDKTMRGQVRVFGALIGAFAAVTVFNVGVIKNTLGRAGKTASEKFATEVGGIAGSFNAISAVSSLVSIFFGGLSASLVGKSSLNEDLVKTIEHNQEKHIDRLYQLLNDAKTKPSAQVLLRKALKRYIPTSFQNPDKNPILLSRLMNDVQFAPNAMQAKQAMEKTVGSYLAEVDPTGASPGKFLDLKAHKGELLKRENHFIAMTNLIEHSSIDEDKDEGFQDLRHGIEKGAERLREKGENRYPQFLKVLGFKGASERAERQSGKEYQALRQAEINSPFFAQKHHLSGAKILENSHQYGPVTVALARLSEGIRVFNTGVLLSLNYQLTRPIAWLSGRVTEHALKIPNSRCTSFSIGRFFSSAIWAIAEAVVIVSLAAGNGVGFNGPEASTNLQFPINIPLGNGLALPISIVSTAAQMLVVSIPAMVFMGAAKIACQVEGWKGDVVRTGANIPKRRQLMEGWS